MNKLIEEISLYIKNLFDTKLSTSFVYHNLQHTRDVVNAVDEISKNSEINDEEKELLLTAAWFHDTGYTISAVSHEENSAEIAESFLKERNYSVSKIKNIKKLILSTKTPQNPQNKNEEIICDADLIYLGYNDLMEKIKLLRMEWESTLNKFYSDSEWLKQNIDFIEANSFHTDYTKKNYGAARKVNLNLLKQKSAEANKEK